MIARRLLCMLLAVVFALATVPLTVAGDTPPPGMDDRNIHPWDNNDGHGSGGPAEVVTRPVIFWFGQTAQVFWVTFARAERPAAKAATAKQTKLRNAPRLTESQAFGR